MLYQEPREAIGDWPAFIWYNERILTMDIRWQYLSSYQFKQLDARPYEQIAGAYVPEAPRHVIVHRQKRSFMDLFHPNSGYCVETYDGGNLYVRIATFQEVCETHCWEISSEFFEQLKQYVPLDEPGAWASYAYVENMRLRHPMQAKSSV